MPGFSGFSWCDGEMCGPCLSCDPGSYKEVLGNSTCDACPPHSTSPLQSSSQQDCVCLAGYEEDIGGLCTACQLGMYKPEDGEGSCIEVPNNSMHTVPTATGFVCNAGFYHYYGDEVDEWAMSLIADLAGGQGVISPVVSPDGSCIPCQSGYYKASPGYGLCLPCPLYSSSEPFGGQRGLYPPAADRCLCDPGYTLELSQCVMCGAGYVKPLPGDFACNACRDPHAVSQEGSMDPADCLCIMGWYFSPEDGNCEPCPEGTYKDRVGNDECTRCAVGSNTEYAESSDQIECLCAKGWTGAGGDLCEICPAGSYKDVIGTSACQACPAGALSSEGTDSLAGCSCDVGLTLSGGRCVPCPEESFKDSVGNMACTSCPTSECEVGMYRTACGGVLGGVCELECVNKPPFSTYKSGGVYSSSCRYDVACPEGSLPLYGTGEQSGDTTGCECAPGYASGDGACTACAPGFFTALAGAGTCTLCPAGNYSSEPASASCPACPALSRSEAGASSIAQCGCLVGFALDPATGSCSLCPAGQTSTGGPGAPCTPCGAREYAVVLVGCVMCMGETVPDTSLSTCICRAGWRGLPGGCAKCPAGTYSDDGTTGECTPCEANSHSAEGAAACLCNAGYSSSQYGTISGGVGTPPCHPCPRGTDSLPGSNACSECEKGSYQDGSPYLCKPCGLFATTERTGSTDSGACSCEDGYSKDSAGVCKLVCPALDLVLTNAQVSSGGGAGVKLEGFSTTVTCMPGFMLASTTPSLCARQATLRCGANGSWTPSPYHMCVPLSCPLATITNAQPFSAASLRYLDSVQVRCKDGYRFPLGEEKNDQISCSDACAIASWENGCYAIPCMALRALANVVPTPVSSREAVFGQNITQTCREGFAVKGTETSTCQKSFYPRCQINQEFDQSQNDLCQPITCPAFRDSQPPAIQQGIVKNAMSTLTPPYKTDVTITCRPSYVPLHKKTMMPCGSDNTMQARCGASDGDATVCSWANDCDCRPVNCGNYTPPAHATLNDLDYTPSKIYYANDLITLVCDPGYMVSPYQAGHPPGEALTSCQQEGNAVCGKDGSFTPFYCIPQVCEHPSSVTAGGVNPSTMVPNP